MWYFFTLALTGVLVGLFLRLRKRKQARQRIFAYFKVRIDSVLRANAQIEDNFGPGKGYFSNYQINMWKQEFANLFNQISKFPFEEAYLPKAEVQSIKTFNNNHTNSEAVRNKINDQFLKEELKEYKEFFDTIEGRELDLQQRTAIITDEDNNLIIAGAGSGKTTTIIGKTSYIINRYHIEPEKILLISFTKKSASTLAQRVNIKGVEAKTFHKFGKDVIAEVDGKQSSIFDENKFGPFIGKSFDELIKNNPGYLKKVTRYFLGYLKPYKSQFDFKKQGEYFQYLKDNNFSPYKVVERTKDQLKTYNREVVKSAEECRIANFLLANGIQYEYEQPYEHDTADNKYGQYKPDFTIVQGDKKIYLEHFGVSRMGQVPNWFKGDALHTASQKYQNDMKWKRDTHAKFKTNLIETFSYEISEGILFDNLSKHLVEAGITLFPKADEDMWKIIGNVASDEIDGFVNLLCTSINLMKSNGYDISNLLSKNEKVHNPYDTERNSAFVEILGPVYKSYEAHLCQLKEIDFSDMINLATKYISDKKYQKSFDYIIIDEFQDISIGRYQLIKALKELNPACKLFCVGDDWQSIYRFAGSDIALFKYFEKYFGFTIKSKIETTYRFADPLIGISSQFILKNPNQVNKELRGRSSRIETNFLIKYSTTVDQDETDSVHEILDLLSSEKDIEEKTILILGRYSFDLNRIRNEKNIFSIDYKNGILSYRIQAEDGLKALAIKAQFLTVHKAKGLEADVIIILNCNSGKYGFPSEISDDPVLNLLLSEADQFENGEERRLFYVAMTRAKEKVFFVADIYYKSKFITEMEVDTGQKNNIKCPQCETADIVLRKTGVASSGNKYRFFGCTNYRYGCDYSKTEWDNLSSVHTKTDERHTSFNNG